MISLIMRFYDVSGGAVRATPATDMHVTGAAQAESTLFTAVQALPQCERHCVHWPVAKLLRHEWCGRQVRLDGVDIRELSLLWYRGQLALVSQCAPAACAAGSVYLAGIRETCKFYMSHRDMCMPAAGVAPACCSQPCRMLHSHSVRCCQTRATRGCGRAPGSPRSSRAPSARTSRAGATSAMRRSRRPPRRPTRRASSRARRTATQPRSAINMHKCV